MDSEATTTIRVVCALLIFVPTLFGIVVLIIALVVFYFDWETVRTNSFYLIMMQIMCSNTCILLVFLYIAFPLILTGTQFRISLAVWVYIFTILIVHHLLGCEKEFSKDGFYIWDHCVHNAQGELHFSDFLYAQNHVVPPTMILLYIAIFIKIRMSRRITPASANMRVEMSFLLQVRTVIFVFT
ncbi:hypothetical protein Y032_0006g3034 [Ancylostoma ceylanicum]|uniref:G-protein coupled receptors family 1 profile domain-containing protein n=1 Tax=Ancylostoma ceylanicum TaxID=53326 RepID=A0A016VS48_9BILA|nr:hypothetical protein Y032_0006g3034 [Ancylostoma ceylanicum]